MFLDTDKLKMALRARKVCGALEQRTPGPGEDNTTPWLRLEPRPLVAKPRALIIRLCSSHDTIEQINCLIFYQNKINLSDRKCLLKTLNVGRKFEVYKVISIDEGE